MPQNIKKPLVITVVVFLLIIFITLLCYALLQFQRPGNKLFRTLILDPIPNSVTILHSQDEIMAGGIIWLHFKISPDDFNLILKSKNWEVRSDLGTGEPNSSIGNWWNPQSLGDNATVCFVIFNYDGHQRDETIWVNSQKNEVYYQVVFIY